MTSSLNEKLSAVLANLSCHSDYAQGALDLLVLLGLVHIEDGRAVSVDAVTAMMIDSLKAHLADGVTVGVCWSDLDGGSPRGVDVLRAAEALRLARVSHPTPARVVQAAQAVIKMRRGQGEDTEDVYLMQYDTHARRFQAIGGKHEPCDVDMEATLRREMAEELVLPAPPGVDQCMLWPLGAGWVETALSATYGILTHYTFTFYQVSDIHFPIIVDNITRWLTRAEIAAGCAADGRPISPIYQQALGWELLDALTPEPLTIG
jgi:hypothetical protein